MAVRGRPGYKVKSLLRARLSVRLDSPGTVKSGRSVGLKIPEPAFQHLPDPGLASALDMEALCICKGAFSLPRPRAASFRPPAQDVETWGHKILPRGRVRDSLSGAGEESESPRCGERGCGFPSCPASSLCLFVSFSLLFLPPSPPHTFPHPNPF